MSHFFAAITFGLSLIAGVTHSKAPPVSVADILAETPETKGVFVAISEDEVRHIQSGLICPVSFPDVDLWHLLVYSKDGSDVGCDYGRSDDDDKEWVTKLTIFAIKARHGETVDMAYVRYEKQVIAKYPSARLIGPAVEFEAAVAASLENVKSGRYEVQIKDKTYRSDLVVAVSKGWVIEIRTTTLSMPNPTAWDQRLSRRALFQALDTVGQASPSL